MLHALCVLAALCAGAARNTIPKEQTPPEHPAFDGFEFLELLDVAEYPRAVAVEHEDAEEQGEELQRPSGISGRSMMSFLESLKGWTSHAFSFPKLLTQIQWNFHPALNDKFYDAKAVGSGTFGVTFLAKTRTEELTGEAGQKVAVKLLKSSDNIWLSPYHYKHLPQIRPYIDLSRAECVDLQAIHRGEDADKEAAEHVVKCLYDGISPQLRSLSDSFAPLYMVMNFVGSDDVDKWWAKQVKHGQGSGANTDILKALKSSVKGMLLGLRFLAESQTDTQWVHHDLKPQNMVVTDDTAETVLVDFGTVLSSKEPKKSSATTMVFAPPTVDHYGLWSEPVGWSPPIWSYDIYQAGATILGMAIGTQLADDGIELNIHAIPLYNFLIATSAQNAAAGFTDVKEVYRCAKNGGGDLLGNMWGCVGKHLVKVYGEEHQRNLQKILESSGDGKKQAIWTVVNCRSWGNEGQVMAKPTNMGTTKTQDFFWILVDDWINTGFDEVLVKMLSTDPEQRPKPSEVLEHAWFKQHTVAAGVPQTYTCPSMPASELEHIQGLLIVATVIAILSCIFVPFPGITYSLKLGGAWWKWLMAWAGFLVVMSPWILYFILDVLWLWIILTLPLGVAMMVLPFVPLSEEQAEKRVTISTALLGSAMGFSILMIPVASSTISMLSYLIEALKDHKAVTVDIAAARDFVTEINHRMVMLPILACLYSLAALITLRLKPGTGATSQAPDSARTPEVSFAKNATSTELTNMA